MATIEFYPENVPKIWAALPAPGVHVTIDRGRGASNSSCSEVGTIRMIFSLPLEHPSSIQDFGVILRVVEGSAPPGIFPDVQHRDVFPLTAQPDHFQPNAMILEFSWYDAPPGKQTLSRSGKIGVL